MNFARGEIGNLISINLLSQSFGGFRARRRGDENWLRSRTEAAAGLLVRGEIEDGDGVAFLEMAATTGLPVNVIASLAEHLAVAPSQDASISRWRCWFFEWLADDPELLEQILRPDDLDKLFGNPFNKIEDVKRRSAYALPLLNDLARLWMDGRPLRDLEIALGVGPEKLKTCDGARKFVMRIVPNLAYLFSLPEKLVQRVAAENEREVVPASSALAQLGQCVRRGFDSHEKAALNYHLRKENLSRRMLHDRFKAIRPHLNAAPPEETWEDTLVRVRAAMDAA